MTATPLAPAAVLLARPAFEGANIRAWIGFKHFMYLVEAAVLRWLEESGAGPGRLYLEHGLGAEIVDCSVQLPATLELDDHVRAEVRPHPDGRLDVQLSIERDGREVVVLRGKARLALVQEPGAPAAAPAPAALLPLVVTQLDDVTRDTDLPPLGAHNGPERSLLAAHPDAFLWSWRARYFHCHWSDRVQHSAYVRALEEVVDRFLTDRGISVGRMLVERSWIPVVSRARVRLAAAARMEETVFTVFTVQDVLRDTLFDARMHCYVSRDGWLTPVATASILHGYAMATGPAAGGMARLDEGVVTALTRRTS